VRAGFVAEAHVGVGESVALAAALC